MGKGRKEKSKPPFPENMSIKNPHIAKSPSSNSSLLK